MARRWVTRSTVLTVNTELTAAGSGSGAEVERWREVEEVVKRRALLLRYWKKNTIVSCFVCSIIDKNLIIIL